MATTAVESSAYLQASQPRPPQPGLGSDAARIPPHVRGWLRWLYPRSRVFAALHQELVLQQSVSTHQSGGDAAFYESQSAEDLMRIHTTKMHQYASWAQETLPGVAANVFARPAPGTEKRFVDLGSAPGGLSCFLHGQLGWSGASLSLNVEAGGMPMIYNGANPPPVPSARPPGSTIAVPKFLARARAAASTKQSDGSSTSSASAKSGGAAFKSFYGDVRSPADTARVVEAAVAGSGQTKVDFAMAGAVQDQSQRVDDSADAEGEARFQAALKNRVEFLCHQLRAVLGAIKDGGSIMFVLGPSECASLEVVVHRVRPFVRGVVRVLRTMHSNKSPVYVLLTDVNATEPDALVAVANAAEIVAQVTAINEDVETRGADVPPWFEAVFESLREDLETTWTTRTERLEQQRRYAQKKKQAVV